MDFAQCRWLPCRDRAYRTVVPSSATKTTGASAYKIAHNTSMRSPQLAALNYGPKSSYVPPISLSQRGIVNKFGRLAHWPRAYGRARSLRSFCRCVVTIARARGCVPCGVSTLALSVIAIAVSTQPNTMNLSVAITRVGHRVHDSAVTNVTHLDLLRFSCRLRNARRSKRAGLEDLFGAQ